MSLIDVTTQMYNEGIKDEKLVMEIVNKIFKCKTYVATKWEDVNLHVDFWCESNNKRYGIDVKGLRKNKRNDKDYDDTINWIELINVQGKNGWVYGKASYIAFLTKKSLLLVSRKKLAKTIEEKINGKDIVHINPNEYYVPYQRNGRLDKIVKVPTADLRNIAKHEIIL